MYFILVGRVTAVRFRGDLLFNLMFSPWNVSLSQNFLLILTRLPREYAFLAFLLSWRIICVLFEHLGPVHTCLDIITLAALRLILSFMAPWPLWPT